MAERISTLDQGYQTGDLSVYPTAIDSNDTLYKATNNAETYLTQSLTFNGKLIIVNDTSLFPDKGIIKIGYESIYYEEKAGNVFKNLVRAFAGSSQNEWPIKTVVQHSVNAEHHNTIKDATINIETNIGLKESPSETSLNGILTAQEKRFLAPKAKFRAFPVIGAPPLPVRFQNISTGEAVRYLWDFGDGGLSTEKNPIHTYVGEGEYTVQLTIFTSLGAEGITIKKNYIVVDQKAKLGFMYVEPEMGTTSTTFVFVDQTDGEIVSRHWIFDDGDKLTIEDPDIHTASHMYTTAGEYNPSLLVVFADTTVKRVFLSDPIIVT